MVVRLRPDKHGYPPFAFEGLWAQPAGGGLWVVDNIPFFARGVSNRDVVAVAELEGELRYKRVVRKGGHSTLRIHFDALDRVAKVRDELRKLGCSSEVSHLPSLVAVDVRKDADYAGVRAMLRALKRDGVLEYEDACVQHSLARNERAKTRR